MASKTRIKVVSNRLPEMVRNLPAATSQVIGKATTDLEAAIKANIVAVGAVDTGNMLNTTQGHHDNGGNRGYVDTAAEYWEVVNYGGAGRAARPFVEPAVDKVNASLDAAVRAALERL